MLLKVKYDKLVKKVKAIKATYTSDLVKIADNDKKFVKLNKKYLIIIMLAVLPIKHSIS